MVKFVHTADWQIGMKAAHVGVVGQKVRSERLESARRVVDFAKKNQADFVIVAGDTFEDNAVDRVLVQKVADILGGFSGPVFIIPGNHDPLVPGSVWEHAAWRSHPNLQLMDRAESVEACGVLLYPCPLFEKHSLGDPTRWIDAKENSVISIGIGHGTVQGISQAELDYPIDRNAACNAGLDYLGLGHWHSFSKYPSSDGIVRMAYSGTHETTKFGERDSGNAILVEIEERGSAPALTPYRTGGLNWISIDEDVSEIDDLDSVCTKIEAIEDAGNSLVELRLNGVFYQQSQKELERIEELIRARFLYGRVDLSKLIPSPTDECWIEELPLGVLRTVAMELKELADPRIASSRADDVSPETATRALLKLYRLVQEMSE